MRRRLLWLPLLVLLFACGGGGEDLLGGFPLSKQLTFRFVNESSSAANMWREPDSALPENEVAPGATLTVQQTETWLSSDEEVTFEFTVHRSGYVPKTITLVVSGLNAQADSFQGYQVTWDGLNVRAEVLTQTSFPLTKSLSHRLENYSAQAVQIWVEPETIADSPSLATGATRTVTQSRTWSTDSSAQTFVFHAQETGKAEVTASATVTGSQAIDPSFSGFVVEWNGTTLTPLRRGGSPFPLNKVITLRFKNSDSTDPYEAANMTLSPEEFSDANRIAPGSSAVATEPFTRFIPICAAIAM